MHHTQNKVDIDLLFETSWEVCNKVGGIYTVLSTKAKNLQTLYKDKIIFIGPDFWSNENPNSEFREYPSLLKGWQKKAELPFGIKARVGRWLVPGRPIAVLVDFKGVFSHLNDFYASMWDTYKVDSLHAYGDYDESCAFAIASAIVIESITRHLLAGEARRVIAHFDEWTTGMGLLTLKSRMPQIATLFTTHATSIGRSICGNGKELYRYFRGYNGDQMADELNMRSKHSLEKAAAHNADCFTTVSDITAEECEQLLDIRPAVVTPNGFEDNFVPAASQFAAKRSQARKSLLDVATKLTGISFDGNTFLIATSGRCEPRNKGLDMFVDSLRRLNDISPDRRAIAFVLVPHFRPAPCVEWVDGTPVIYIPSYLDGADGLLNKSYYDTLIGFDATVFASYYEPWGYTPLESIAFGVPTITTSLSGFGRWILANFTNDITQTGVKVAMRDDSSYDNTVGEIADTLLLLMGSPADLNCTVSKAAVKTASQAAWDLFIEYYIKAFQIALSNANKRTVVK